jgi:hypothetical protein
MCGCGGKKRGGNVDIPNTDLFLVPTYWGPLVWNYLHCLTEKIGVSGNKIIDTDEANYMNTIITMLPLILPCVDCQAHCKSYMESNPFPTLKGIFGAGLQSTIRTWLFNFHNTVRATLNQSIMIATAEDCRQFYEGCVVRKSDYATIIQCSTLAIQKGWVRIGDWRKWYSNSERLRLLTGAIQ